MRCFVGVWPDADAMAALATVPRLEAPAVRWVPPHRWHVTLAFLGEIPDMRREQSVDALNAAAWRIDQAPVVTLGPATVALGRSVLCVPADGLEPAATAVRAAALEGGVAFDRTAFRGHLTLGRARRRGGAVPPDLIGVPVSTGWTAREICLIASVDGPRGVRYETLATVAVS